MLAAFSHTMLVQNRDGIGVLDGGEAVSDNDDRSPCGWEGNMEEVKKSSTLNPSHSLLSQDRNFTFEKSVTVKSVTSKNSN